MVRLARVFVGVGLTACLLSCGGSAREGREANTALRIVSTAPCITETLFALGLGGHVVGVTDYCHYPPQARKLPKIGTFLNPSLEAILDLRPDLVFILENPIRLSDRLAELHLRSVEVSTNSVADMEASIVKIGSAAGVPDRARKLVSGIRRELDRIHQATARFPKRRVVFIIGRTPAMLEGMVAAGRASYLDDLMRIAGCENIFQDAASQYPKVSMEEILARDPDVIIDMGDMAQTDGVTEEHKRSVVALWERYPTLAAVKEHRIYAVAADIFVVPGPRVAEAALQFARMAHPEAGL